MKQWFVNTYKTIRLSVLVTASYINSHRLSFLIGLIVGILALIFLPKLAQIKRSQAIGLTGNYTVSNLPLEIQNKISFGLTKLLPDGTATSGAAVSWEATDSGKTINFTLDRKASWQDGQPFTSDGVNYNLRGVQLSRPAGDKVQFILKEPFAPLISTLSQPLFKNGLMGLGDWQVDNISLTGRFISSLSLANRQTNQKQTYKFYPSESSLVTALKLGSVTTVKNIHSKFGLENDRHFRIETATASSTIATLFFNLESETVSDKSVRQGLIYALPNQFPESTVAFAPVVKDSWTETDIVKVYSQNLDTAQRLINKSASQSGKIKIKLGTSRTLEETAKIIVESWKKVGVDAKIEITDIPDPTFDAYLTYLELPADPDQYPLWHSTQAGNISHYKSAKVDKLLEEGRRTIDSPKRADIYAQFYRAITEDVPAAFLFYPNLYTITRI